MKITDKIGIKSKEDLWSAFWQFFKFGLVGLSNTAISLLIYYIFIFINEELYIIGNIAGFMISVLNSFYWNNKYVFKSQGKCGWFKKLLRTYVAYGGTFLLSTGLLFIEVQMFSLNEWIAPVINLLITIPVNFIINKYWAFKK